jgi:hypothetical protein
MAGKVTVARIGSYQPSGKADGRACRLFLGGRRRLKVRREGTAARMGAHGFQRPPSLALLHVAPERGSLFPPDGLHVARTEKPHIPYRIVVGGHPRDGTLRKPDHHKRVLHDPRCTILPGFVRPAELPILGGPKDLPDEGLGGPWMNLACLLEDAWSTGTAEEDSDTQDDKRSSPVGPAPRRHREGGYTMAVDRGLGDTRCVGPDTAELRDVHIPSCSGGVVRGVTRATAHSPSHAVIVHACAPGINRHKIDRAS